MFQRQSIRSVTALDEILARLDSHTKNEEIEGEVVTFFDFVDLPGFGA